MSKVIPLNRQEMVRNKIFVATAKVLSSTVSIEPTLDTIAEVSGLSRGEIYRQYATIEELVQEFSEESDFWPTVEELVGEDGPFLESLTPQKLVSEFCRRYLKALLGRPQTLEIMARELAGGQVVKGLEHIRVRTALQFFEFMHEDPSDEVDLTAVVLIVAAVIHFLAVNSLRNRTLGGVALDSDKGWERILNTLDCMLKGVLGE